MPRLSCDVFCKVVDNFGDAAVAWRLARILANEHQLAVRFFIDDPRPLAKLLGLAQLDIKARIDQVQIICGDDAQNQVADIVMETFGCGLPTDYASRLQKTSPQPAWINVEYLSAETWVEGFHGLPSPPGDGGATRHFFFPGLTHATGGVLRERDLWQRRDAFLANERTRQAFWTALGVLNDVAQAPKVLMFCYTRGWPEDLFFRIAQACAMPLHLILPEGVLPIQARAFCGNDRVGAQGRANQLQVSVVPFLAQTEFDPLLWACDGVLVRGEDSFVRAQLAGRPMLWDIYPQKEAAHLVKLHAFLNRYASAWPQDDVKDLIGLSLALSDRSTDFESRFVRWCENLARYTQSSEIWRQGLARVPELGDELAKFARKLLEY